MTAASIEYVSAERVFEILRPRGAVAAIEHVLRGGFNTAADPPRTIVDVANGQLLLMPSESGTAVGTKVATVAPGNPARGLDKIQALYIHFEAQTLTPRLLIDGTALTALRTPAVSLAAISPVVLGRETPLDVVIFGAGPQGLGHAATLRAVVEGRRGIASVTFAVRQPERVDPVTLGDGSRLVTAGSPEALAAVAAADLIMCATGSAVPVFDSAGTRPDVTVVAIGSHDPDRREVDGGLCARAQVVVESRESALRECGDVVLAIADGMLVPEALIPMADVVTGRTALDPSRPVFFKGSGMAWQDVAVAGAIADAL